MIVYDAAGVKTAISPDGSGSVYDAAGRRVSTSSVTSALYSFDNPPGSPSSYDDEFDALTLDSKWTVTSTGTTNPAVAGTVNPVSSLTTPVYDLATWPSWLLFQSDNSSAQTVEFKQTVSLGTDATFFYKASVDNRNLSASSEGNIRLELSNSTDNNEFLNAYIQENTGTNYRYRLQVNNNGVVTDVVGGVIPEATPISNFYIACWKNGNDYYAGFSLNSNTFTVVGPVTKTGVTNFDRVALIFVTANETPSLISGVDFFRYYGSVNYGLRNAAV